MTRRALGLIAACGAFVFVGAGVARAADIGPSPPMPSSGGERLYQQHCAACHGRDLRGTDKGPSHLHPIYQPHLHSDVAFRLAIQNGSPQHHWRFGAMPPVPGLAPDEVAAIVAYVRSEQRKAGVY